MITGEISYEDKFFKTEILNFRIYQQQYDSVKTGIVNPILKPITLIHETNSIIHKDFDSFINFIDLSIYKDDLYKSYEKAFEYDFYTSHLNPNLPNLTNFAFELEKQIRKKIYCYQNLFSLVYKDSIQFIIGYSKIYDFKIKPVINNNSHIYYIGAELVPALQVTLFGTGYYTKDVQAKRFHNSIINGSNLER